MSSEKNAFIDFLNKKGRTVKSNFKLNFLRVCLFKNQNRYFIELIAEMMSHLSSKINFI